MLRSPLGHHLASLSSRAKLAVMVGIDAIFLPLCMLASVSLRLGSLEAAVQAAPTTQFLIGFATLPVLGFAGLYRTVVRYIDLRVVVASSLALAAAVLATFGFTVVFNVLSLPRSALLVYWFVAFAYVVTSRFVARAVLRQGLRHARRPRVRTAIYGAGAAGAQLAQTMQFSVEYKAVCFLDDDPSLHAKTVAALKVYSPDALQEAVYRHDVEQIVVAIPSAGVAQKRELIARVESAGLPVKILPSLAQLVDGSAASLADIRDLDVADLLGRDPVPPQAQLFARNIVGKVVLVTGAGGSIGAELCRQIVSQRPRRLVLLDHAEFSLYALEQELRGRLHGVELNAHLGSVVDEVLVLRLLREHAVQTVYHAAAYKHVPMLEDNVQQGVRNNVFGTLAVARAAVAASVETCVLVSTDKAVRPTNVMGATKRAAELIFQAAAQRGGPTRFSMVRFGNVLGSSGSVVPLFKQQIHAGGPITITHPDIIRYFMLIPEAAQLVIQAGAMARGGEVFVLDMGEPVRIVELARSMIRLAGLTEKTADQPDGDIEIQYVGLRPGEKLFEELLIGNDAVPSGHPRILSAHERHIDPALLDKMLESLRGACDGDEHEAMLRRLRNLVPEFRSPDEVNRQAAPALSGRQ